MPRKIFLTFLKLNFTFFKKCISKIKLLFNMVIYLFYIEMFLASVYFFVSNTTISKVIMLLIIFFLIIIIILLSLISFCFLYFKLLRMTLNNSINKKV